ncbi:hypothetical protein TU94_32105 [Streptomyces cyaneogriseus subsp. noncyanogenus]|uniref:Adenylate kinase n=1 Tax=Streptomyces cyaneogriseus subsp. noncyanogenus TaxID=477245 RepID=A0A0C5G962_9ACTN|nr:hypothetical protein TU94_32105 [Streptomyces cyaneogriseus subsp. noncyanogenus]
MTADLRVPHPRAKRLEVYRSETAPVVDHYRTQGLVTTISALGQVQEVLDRALVAIGQARSTPPAR